MYGTAVRDHTATTNTDTLITKFFFSWKIHIYFHCVKLGYLELFQWETGSLWVREWQAYNLAAFHLLPIVLHCVISIAISVLGPKGFNQTVLFMSSVRKPGRLIKTHRRLTTIGVSDCILICGPFSIVVVRTTRLTGGEPVVKLDAVKSMENFIFRSKLGSQAKDRRT